MKITFDPKKDINNRAEHGVSLALARDMDWERSMDWIDKRFNYDELRMCAIGVIGDQIYYVAYVDRDETRRVISLRKATKQEAQKYVQQAS